MFIKSNFKKLSFVWVSWEVIIITDI
jgi:hypothetical protein